MPCDRRNQLQANCTTSCGVTGTTLAWNASATKPFTCRHLKGGCTPPSTRVPATRHTCQSKEEMRAFLTRSGSARSDRPFRRHDQTIQNSQACKRFCCSPCVTGHCQDSGHPPHTVQETRSDDPKLASMQTVLLLGVQSSERKTWQSTGNEVAMKKAHILVLLFYCAS